MLEQVEKISYLGSLITENAACKIQDYRRMSMAQQVLTKLSPFWKIGTLSRQIKWRLVKAHVWPVATYGSESWTFDMELHRRLDSFENKCARRVLCVPVVFCVCRGLHIEPLRRSGMIW